MPKISSFLPNIGSKSFKKNFSASLRHSFSDYAEMNYDHLVTAKELYGDSAKELLKNGISVSGAMRDAKKMVTESQDYKDLQEVWGYFKSDLRSGKFYNEDRADAGFESQMEEEMAEFDKEFGDEDESFDDLDKEAEQDDKLASDINRGIKAGSTAVAGSIASGSEYVGGMVRESAKLSYAQSAETNRLLRTGLLSISNDVRAILKFDTTAFKTHIENSTNFFKTTTDLLTKQNQMFEELLEMQRNLYKAEQQRAKNEDEQNKRLTYTDVVENGIPNLEKYKKAIRQNFDDTMIGSFYNMFQEMGGFKGMFANPLSFVSDAIVSGIIGPSLEGALKETNNMIGGLFGTLMNNLNKYADENSGPLGMLADIFGLRTYEKKRFDLSKFEKGPVAYNGVTDKTIVEVIPTYLRRIESALTGGPERIFNMRTGMWTTVGRLKEVYDRERDTQLSAPVSDFVESMKPLLREYSPMKNGQFDQDAYIQLQKDLVKVLDKIVEDNGYFNFAVNPETGELPKGLAKYYGVDERNLNFLAAAFRNAPKDQRMMLADRIRTAKDDRTRFMDELENTTWVPERLLFNGAYAGTPYSVRNSYYNFGVKKDSLPIEEEPKLFVNYANTQKDMLSVLQHMDFILYHIALKRKVNKAILKSGTSYFDREALRFVQNVKDDTGGQVVNRTVDGKTTVTTKDSSAKSWNYDSQYPFDEHESAMLGTSRLGISRSSSAKLGIDEKTEVKKFSEAATGWARTTDKMSEMYSDRIDPNADLKAEYGDLKGTGFLDKFSNAKGIYDKYVAVAGFVTALRDKPSQFMGNLVRAANTAIYDLFFDRPTELRDEKGRKISGFFDVMTHYAKSTFTGIKDFAIDNVFKPLGNIFDDTFGTGFGEPLAEVLGDSVGDAMEELAKVAGNAIQTVASDVGKWKDEAKRAGTGYSIDSILGQNVEAREALMDAFTKVYQEKVYKDAGLDPTQLTPEDIENLIRANYAKGTTAKGWQNREFVDNLKRIKEDLDSDDEQVVDRALGTLRGFSNEEDPDKILNAMGIGSLYIPKTKLNRKTGKVETEDANPDNTTKEQYEAEQAKTQADAEAKAVKENEDSIINNLTRIMGKAYGDKYVKETGLYTLSKGEAVIPSDMNPFNPNRENANRAKDKQNEIKFLRRLGSMGIPVKGNFAEGTKDADSISDKIKDGVESVKDKAKGVVKKIRGDKSKEKEAEDEAVSTLKDMAPDIFKGAGGGALGGLLLNGGPTGIFAGAAIGSGLMLAKRTEFVKNFLYGEADENGVRTGGLLNRGIFGKLKKMLPDMRDYGLIGAAAGFVTPLGVIGGALLGASIGFIKNSDRARRFLFGEGKLSEEKNFLQRFLSEQLPRHLLGTGIGGLIVGGLTGGSPIGIVGGMMLGGGLSFLQTSDKFKDLMLGTVDPVTKQRKGGVLGMLKLSMVDPLVERATQIQERFFKYMRADIFDPITRAFDPFKQSIKVGARTLFTSIRDKVAEYFNPSRARLALGAAGRFLGRNAGGVGLGALGALAISSMTGIPLTYTMAAGSLLGATKPMRFLGKKAFGLIPKGISGVTNAIENAGDAVNRKLIRSGNAENLSAARRLELMQGEDYRYRTLDEYIAGSNKETIQNTLAELEALRGNQRDRRKMLSDAEAKMRDTFNEYGMDMMGDTGANALINAIKEGNSDEASRIINESKRLNPESRRQLSNQLADMMADYNRKKSLTNDETNLSEENKKFFADMGIDITDKHGLDKVIRNLKSESLDRTDDNEPNKITNGLDKLHTAAQESNYYLRLIAMSVSGSKPTEKDKEELEKIFGKEKADEMVGNIETRTEDIKREESDTKIGAIAAKNADDIRYGNKTAKVRSDLFRELGSKDGSYEDILTAEENNEVVGNLRDRSNVYYMLINLAKQGKIKPEDLPKISRMSDKEIQRMYNFLRFNMSEGYSDKLASLVSEEHSNASQYGYNQNAQIFENLRGFQVSTKDIEDITNMSKYQAKGTAKLIERLGERGISGLSLSDINKYQDLKNANLRAQAQDQFNAGDMEAFTQTLADMGIDKDKIQITWSPVYYGSSRRRTLKNLNRIVAHPILSILYQALRAIFSGTVMLLKSAAWILKALALTPAKLLAKLTQMLLHPVDTYWRGVRKRDRVYMQKAKQILVDKITSKTLTLDVLVSCAGALYVKPEELVMCYKDANPWILDDKEIRDYMDTSNASNVLREERERNLLNSRNRRLQQEEKESETEKESNPTISNNYSSLSQNDVDKYSNPKPVEEKSEAEKATEEVTEESSPVEEYRSLFGDNYSNLADEDVKKYSKGKKKKSKDKDKKNKPKPPKGGRVRSAIKALRLKSKYEDEDTKEGQVAAIIPVASYAEGTENVKSDQTAVVSKGEAIVSKDENPMNDGKDNSKKRGLWSRLKTTAKKFNNSEVGNFLKSKAKSGLFSLGNYLSPELMSLGMGAYNLAKWGKNKYDKRNAKNDGSDKGVNTNDESNEKVVDTKYGPQTYKKTNKGDYALDDSKQNKDVQKQLDAEVNDRVESKEYLRIIAENTSGMAGGMSSSDSDKSKEKSSIFEDIKNAISALWPLLLAGGALAKKFLQKALDRLKKTKIGRAVLSAKDFLKDKANKFKDNIKDFAKKGWDKLTSKPKQALNMLKALGLEGIDKFKSELDDIVTKAKGMKDTAMDALDAGKNKIKGALDDISDAVKQKLAQAISTMKDGLKKIASVASKFVSKDLMQKLSKLFTNIIEKAASPQFMKKAASRVAKGAAKQGAAAASSLAGPIGLAVVNAAIIGWSFYEGWNNAAKYFKLKDDQQPSVAQQLISGVAEVIMGYIPVFGWFFDGGDLINFAKMVFGSDLFPKAEKKDEKQDITITGRLKSGISSMLESGKNAIVDFGKGLYNTAATFGDNLYTSIKTTITGIWDSIAGIPEQIGEKIQALWEEIKQKIWDMTPEPVRDAIDWGADKANYVFSGQAATDFKNWINNGLQTITTNGSKTPEQVKQEARDRANNTGKGKYGRGGGFMDPSAFASQYGKDANMRFNAPGDTEFQTVKDSGCGPAAAVNAIKYVNGKGGLDVGSAAKYALQKGYKEKDGGTEPQFFNDIFNKSGLDSKNVSHNNSAIMDNLNQGNPVVLMGKDSQVSSNNPYGPGPHYVTATGTDGKGNIVVQDSESGPNKVYKASNVLNKTSIAIAARAAKTARNARRSIKQGLGKYANRYRYGRAIDVPEAIWNFLTGKGLGSAVVAGIMGNMFQESRYDPTAENPDSGAYGICQWLGPRKDALAQKASSMGTTISDLNAQLEYLWDELQGPEHEALVATINCGDNVELCTKTFYEKFERGGPGEAMFEVRVPAAMDAFQKQGKGIATGTTYNGPSASGTSSGSQSSKPSGLYGALDFISSALDSALNFGMGKRARNKYGKGFDFNIGNVFDEVTKNPLGTVDETTAESVGSTAEQTEAGKEAAGEKKLGVSVPKDKDAAKAPASTASAPSSGPSFDVGGKFASQLSPLTSGLKSLSQSFLGAVSPMKSMFKELSNSPMGKMLSDVFGENPFTSLFESPKKQGGPGTAGSITAGGTSANPDIRKASAYANSRVGGPGHGSSGCTEWVNEYLNAAGIAPINTWVPTAYEDSRDKSSPYPWKEPSQGSVEGDVAVIDTDGKMDEPDHVVISDGQGGYWGNSSKKNQIVHGNMSDWGAENIWGYIGSGGPGTTANNNVVSGSSSMSLEQRRAEAGPTSGGGKYGRGKYGRSVLDQIQTNIDASPEAQLVDTNVSLPTDIAQAVNAPATVSAPTPVVVNNTQSTNEAKVDKMIELLSSINGYLSVIAKGISSLANIQVPQQSPQVAVVGGGTDPTAAAAAYSSGASDTFDQTDMVNIVKDMLAISRKNS